MHHAKRPFAPMSVPVVKQDFPKADRSCWQYSGGTPPTHKGQRPVAI
jgi:hypothetical protein